MFRTVGAVTVSRVWLERRRAMRVWKRCRLGGAVGSATVAQPIVSTGAGMAARICEIRSYCLVVRDVKRRGYPLPMRWGMENFGFLGCWRGGRGERSFCFGGGY